MFELSEEHRMLQDLVAKFVDRELIPLEKAVLAREMSGQKSSLTARGRGTAARQVPRTRPVGSRRAGGIRRRQSADRRADRRLRRTGPHLRALHLPARQPEPAHADGGRQSGTTQEIPGTLRARRGAVGDRDLRTRRRRRSGGNDHPRGQGRRRLGDQRTQDLGQPRAAVGFHHRHGAHRRGQTPRGRHRLHRRARHQGVHHRTRNPDARRPAHLRTGVRGLPHPGIAGARPGRPRLCADAAAPDGAAAADWRMVRRHDTARARHDDGACAAARHVWRAAGGSAGDPVVDRRRRDQDPRVPADGLRRGDEVGRRQATCAPRPRW